MKHLTGLVLHHKQRWDCNSISIEPEIYVQKDYKQTLKSNVVFNHSTYTQFSLYIFIVGFILKLKDADMAGITYYCITIILKFTTIICNL